MHCVKTLRASRAGILLIRNAGKWERVAGNLDRRHSPARLLHTSASPGQHPRHQHVITETDAATYRSNKVVAGLEDLLFYTITQGEEKISVARFLAALKSTGLLTSDPRLRECMRQIHQAIQESVGTAMMDQELFRKHAIGDTDMPFCLQSCVKPLEYALAVHETGTELVHRYVGKEPSGLKFNKLYLDEEDKPHNPMVNAGAIVISSLLKPGSNKAEKFDFMMDYLNRMAGREYVGFSNATFQSEKETGDRNYAIGYYLKEKRCFPSGVDMMAALDFYFQLCSIEVTCESGSVMAATLANGGICPITGERVLSAEAVRNTLSLMHSCGMYDFSGQFAFHVGLPAKSGVSGAMLLVVPNIMGMMCWSPALDRVGNSIRGIHFCQELVSLFNFHNYDNLRHFAKKLDPRRQTGHERNKSVVDLMFAAYSGDVSALRRIALSAVNMELTDYDTRTSLHVASAEGHLDAVKFLTHTCKVNPYAKDRWGNTPLDDAMQFGHSTVVKALQEYQSIYTHTLMPEELSADTCPDSTMDADELKSMETLDGLV
ncbi:glutaminase kidney isoform, mitochondrial-like isoform X2 [Sinocyclocheilus rhinocerous]|uniref:glutaminase kidney isoform, mitochondrial-like isoform X2 n=1 Tax=Sinocyclocheilus rhinocerous TaxID=307959 RepID=UPI0007BA8AE5|nr:PREDICTED: glutaminase kidney isoform, mitochondrial-like isoform X2 [Sinocyclocheilus rhinocerous]